MRQILVEASYAAMWRDLLDGITLYIRERHAAWELHCVPLSEFVAGLAQKPDGALCVLHHDQAEAVAAVRKAGAPTVNMLRNLHPELPSVFSDHELIGERAADYFLAHGFSHFAFLGPDRDWSNARERGFKRRLEAAGRETARPSPAVSIAGLRTIADGRAKSTLRRWVVALPKPVAVLAAADFVARALLDACRDARRRVPEDVAIIGVDNDVAICELAPIRLSSIPQNLQRIGFEAARLLDGLMSARRRPRGPLMVPPRELVVRRSTDVFAAADPRIAATLRLIHSRPPGSIGMKDILDEVKVSRQWLDRMFKGVVGRTPSEELRRRRLERVRNLLEDTHLSIQQIAGLCGFSQPENMTRFFREATGLSPIQFRQRKLPPEQ